MKNLLRFICLFALLAGGMSWSRAAQVEGILITASNQSGETDRRLAAYEPVLRRILRFESYQYIGSDSRGVPEGGSQRLALGGGHVLEVAGDQASGAGTQIKVRWTASGRTLMNTGLVLRPGVPAVLGGPSTGSNGDVFAVILIAH